MCWINVPQSCLMQRSYILLFEIKFQTDIKISTLSVLSSQIDFWLEFRLLKLEHREFIFEFI